VGETIMSASVLPVSASALGLTHRLYYDDPYLKTFTARRIGQAPAGDRVAVILDRTAFYPTGGGQAADRGTLNDVPVMDVIEREEDGAILHVLASPLNLAGQELIVGVIDWPCRFDRMQQHSGQHLLSAGFDRLLGASTISFHLGDEVCTIDLDRETLTPEESDRVELAVNQVIWENRPIRASFPPPEELERLDIRGRIKVSGPVRIVEIEGFDRNPCGGTHVRAAGEIGMIKIRRWERHAGGTRVEFLCGRRALVDYGVKTRALNQVAAALSVRDWETPEAVARVLAEAEAARRQLNLARSERISLEAETLLLKTPVTNGRRLICQAWPERHPEELRRLAQRLTAGPGVVALLGAISGDRAHLVFARSADRPEAMHQLLGVALAQVGGKGGGQPGLAQGSGPQIAQLDAALEVARCRVVGNGEHRA